MRSIRGLVPLALLTAAGCAPAPVLPPTLATAPPAAAEVTAESVASPTPEVPTGCPAVVEGLSLDEQVGQLFMVGVSTAGLDEATRRAISLGRVGSVVLLGNSTAGIAETRALTAELGSLGTVELPLLVAVDQEGGSVQRLTGAGFDDIPPAVEQGTWADDELRAEAETWGGQLAEAGVRLNLAPVADLVAPGHEADNDPIGGLGRHYATDAGVAAARVSSFVEGMHAAGIGTSLKHFPGLGRVGTNTDFGEATDDVTTRDDPSVDVFRAGLDAGADTVMVSSAVFQRIDPDNEGVFSETIITDLLRGEIGFKGVVLADDLGAAQAVADVQPAERAVRFLEAGGDLAINADPALMSEMIDATVTRAGSDDAFADRVAESALRVLELKERLGLTDCG